MNDLTNQPPATSAEREPVNMTRGCDSMRAIGGKFSVDAVLTLNPQATRADVLALALERADGLHAMIDAIACCKSGVAYEVGEIAAMFLGPADDVRLLLTALQDMDRRGRNAGNEAKDVQ